jgi:hypothetical protein
VPYAIALPGGGKWRVDRREYVRCDRETIASDRTSPIHDFLAGERLADGIICNSFIFRHHVALRAHRGSLRKA